MSATVAGAPYTSALCIAYTSGNNVEIEAETTTAGATLTYPYISLWLNRTSLTTGTFSLDSTQLNNYAEYITSVSTFKLAKSGSITITSISPDVVGTFSFTCTDSTVVTNGKFVAESL